MGVIKACGQTPNCVSSTDPRQAYAIQPLAFTGSVSETKKSLLKIIAALPGSRLAGNHGPYLHFEFTSRFLRFIDDVEFFFDEDLKQIEMRSASRTGRYDLGVNRKRLNLITKHWNQLLTKVTFPFLRNGESPNGDSPLRKKGTVT